MKEQKRFHSLDSLKAVAAILVCYQHACGTGMPASEVLAFAKIAVPLFAMITGFFYVNTFQGGRCLKQIKRFFVIGIEIVLLYTVIDIIYNLLNHSLAEYAKEVFNLHNLMLFFVFNDPVSGDHSWYIWAMVYILVIVLLVPVIWKRKTLRTVIMLASLLALPLLSKYVELSGVYIPYYFYRNSMIPIIGFFLTGVSIREYYSSEKCLKYTTCRVLVVLACAALIAEKYFATKNGIDMYSGNYLSSVLLAIMLFLWILTEPVMKNNSWLSRAGAKYSLIFYIVHPFFVKIEVRVFHMDNWQQYIGFAGVCVLSLIASVLVYRIKNIGEYVHE